MFSPEAREQPVNRIEEIRERWKPDYGILNTDERVSKHRSRAGCAVPDIAHLLAHIDKLTAQNNQLRNPKTYESTQKVAPPPEMY